LPIEPPSVAFVEPRNTTDSTGVDSGKTRSSLILPTLSLVGGIIQGACAILIASSSLKVLVGLTALAAAMKSSRFHSDVVRIPLIVISSALACWTLFVVWNGWRLRNRTAARWRKKSLTFRQKLAICVSVASALVTLSLVIGEIVVHPIF
jgi:hypothetical protein